MSTQLTAGVARADITPKPPIDLVGYSRRWEPATSVRYPLTVTALVFENGDRRIVLVALDLLALRPSQADEIRAEVAAATGTVPAAVMLNVSHTHAGPQAHLGGVKIGGSQRNLAPGELKFIARLPETIARVSSAAANSMRPARIDAGVGALDLAVNRRERTSDGRTILGWNPDESWDRDVAVLRVDTLDDEPLALVVNFACHPVVVGPEDLAINADFPGPMRERLEKETNAVAVFFQGAGGNVLPLEGFHDHTGPEKEFGDRLALEALHVAADLQPNPTRIHKVDYGSVTPISLYRRVRVSDPPDQTIDFVGKHVDLPLKRVPTAAELMVELEKYQSDLRVAEDQGLGQEQLNPLEYHVNWAEEALRQVRAGEARRAAAAYLQAFRVGDVLISAIPGEVFSEIAIQIKERSPSDLTLFAGYTNGVLSYLPTAAEFPHGGYECDYAHHSFGLVEQVAPESESILVEESLALLNSIWARR